MILPMPLRLPAPPPGEPPLRPRLAQTLSAGLPVTLAELDALGSAVPVGAQGFRDDKEMGSIIVILATDAPLSDALLRGLANLSAILDKALLNAEFRHVDAAVLLQARLAPDGLFCQWLPLHQMDRATLAHIVAVFLFWGWK